MGGSQSGTICIALSRGSRSLEPLYVYLPLRMNAPEHSHCQGHGWSHRKQPRGTGAGTPEKRDARSVINHKSRRRRRRTNTFTHDFLGPCALKPLQIAYDERWRQLSRLPWNTWRSRIFPIFSRIIFFFLFLTRKSFWEYYKR